MNTETPLPDLIDPTHLGNVLDEAADSLARTALLLRLGSAHYEEKPTPPEPRQ